MPNMSNVDPSIVFAMFKGEPGTRKSTAALSFPTPQYWFSYDRKMNGMMIPMRNWGIDPTLVQYDDYDNWDKARVKMEQFQTTCNFKTIVVDSVTTLADAAIRQIIKGKAGSGKKIGTVPVSGYEEFNAEAAALQEMIFLLKDINAYHKVNIILIAHVLQVDYKDAEQITHVSRTIVTAAKKVAAKLPAYCGEVYHFNIKTGFDADAGGQYSLLSEHTGADFARTALPLPKEIVFGGEPLYSKFIAPAIARLKANPDKPVSF